MAINPTAKNEYNYYELLEVSPEAPQNEIHEAFRRAKKTYSPDSPALYSMFSPEEARELMRLIEEAFSVLGNQALRKEYDKKLRRQAGAPGSDAEIGEGFDGPFQEPDPFSQTVPSDMAIPEADILMDDFTPEETSSPLSAETSSQNPSASTVLSQYEVNPEMEEEISRQTVFDGTFLHKVREYKQVTLPRLSDYTRVSQTYLRAIEENDYKALPAPVFTRGFVVQLAKVLELDHQAVATSYMQLYKDSVKK